MVYPENFLDCIKSTLGEDFDDYMKYIEDEPFRGLRINRLKADERILEKLGFDYRKAPFSPDGYYIPNSAKSVGNHPLHHAGAFYLQEPSAMSAATALDAQPYERVLDLCAAPGGKSTQIASAMQGGGLLVANEIVPSRAKILAQNLERMGAKNTVVTNARPDELAEKLKGFFDRILVDAPCSGEGMLRREPNIITEWQPQNRQICADRQLKILDSADEMLKVGGVLVYSTCTLAEDENEQVIANFIKSHPYYEIEEIQTQFGRNAYKRFAPDIDIEKARRILPPDGGEGHFVARLKKTADTGECYDFDDLKAENIDIVSQFLCENFSNFNGRYTTFNNFVQLVPEQLPKLKGIRIINRGVTIGELKGKRFEPSHALYTSSVPSKLKNTLDLTLDDSRIYEFLKGMQIECDTQGYTAVTIEGITVGFGKASGGRLNNRYPKGLRVLG